MSQSNPEEPANSPQSAPRFQSAKCDVRPLSPQRRAVAGIDLRPEEEPLCTWSFGQNFLGRPRSPRSGGETLLRAKAAFLPRLKTAPISKL